MEDSPRNLHPYICSLHFMLNANFITQEWGSKMRTMLLSKDIEMYRLAVTIITSKDAEYMQARSNSRLEMYGIKTGL